MIQAWLKQIFSDPVGVEGKVIRRRQLLRLSLFVAGLGLFIWVTLNMQNRKNQGAQIKQMPKVTLASDSVDVRDVWSHRMMEKANAKNEEIESLRLENKVMQQRVDALEAVLKSLPHGARQDTEGPPSQPFSIPPESVLGSLSGSSKANHPEVGQAPELVAKKPPAKIAFVSLEEDTSKQFHSDEYVVAGSYSKAALLSGLVVSTAVAAQSNPQPIAIRLLDSGNLPRGWPSQVKDAVLVGSCYGDLSSERAMCRINTLSFVEEDGTGVEIAVEGWIFGEDGAAGLRGKVVDRAGEIARESLFAGILGGMSNFLKHEATSSVFPVTPFGQTNALSNRDVLKGSLGNGASNALDKLAEFSIKRAEAMQPVIVVNGGRQVDVLFKKGFSLKRSVQPTMKLKVDQ